MTMLNKSEKRFFFKKRKEILSFLDSLTDFNKRYDEWLGEHLIKIMKGKGFKFKKTTPSRESTIYWFSKEAWATSKENENYFDLYIYKCSYLSNKPLIGIQIKPQFVANIDKTIKSMNVSVDRWSNSREFSLDIDNNDVIGIADKKPKAAIKMYEKEIGKFLKSEIILAIDSAMIGK